MSSATKPQVQYIKDMLGNRAISDEARERGLAKLDAGISFEEAKVWIPWLIKQPRLPREAVATEVDKWRVEYEDVPTDKKDKVTGEPVIMRIGKLMRGGQVIPAGSYAIETPEDPDNNVKFYRLWIGDRYGWKVYMIAGPDEHAASYPWAMKVLDEISVDPGAAASRYGHAIGKCGICGRRLSRQSSRDRGIGPICAAKWGWD